MLRFLDAGETHGKCIVAIVEGLPSNVFVDIDKINEILKMRCTGYGRGGRMKIESDSAVILSGVRNKKTLGSPVAIMIENRDFENWKDTMSPFGSDGSRAVYTARPGHADLGGFLKYGHKDMRNVLERASARETAIRTAVGALCECMLDMLDIKVRNRVVSIGSVFDSIPQNRENIYDVIEKSDLFMYDEKAANAAKKLIDEAKEKGESLGGIVETEVINMPPAIGSYVHYDRKLDAAVAGALMSVQAIKGVEFGMGFASAEKFGSEVHDGIYYDGKYKRRTNNAGGIEGGMSNGENIIVRAAMKPIPTLYSPLESVDIRTNESALATVERSDICAVPACSVVCREVVAFEIAKAILNEGINNIDEILCK